MGDALKRDTSLQCIYRKGEGGDWGEGSFHVATEWLLK